MADISLPDIMGETPLVGGKIEEQFGQQVQNFGINLLNAYNGQQKALNAQQQALLDMETAKQVIQAKSIALATVDEFNKGLDTNIDYTSYGTAWDQQRASLNDQLSTVLKLPSAKQTFQEWWVPAQSKQTEYVYGQTREKTVASAQATANVAIDEMASQGNEQGIYDTIKYGVAQGLFSAAEASGVAKGKIPEAHFNKVFSYLDKNGNEADALNELTQGGAADKWGLSADQLTSMISKFSDKLAAQTRVADAAVKKQQTATFGKLLEDSSNPETMPTRDNVSKAMSVLVGSEYYTQAKQIRDAIDAETTRIEQASADFGETKLYSQFKTSMLMWSGTEKPPWDPTIIDAALTNEDPALRITKADADKLTSLYEQTMNDLKSGTRKGPNFDDPDRVAEMVAKVFADGPSVTDKVVAINPYLANGVSPGTWQKFRGLIDEYNGREDWKTAMRPVTTYYTAAIQDPINGDKRQELALEQGAAAQAMISVFRQYPNDPAMWKQASDSIMDKSVLPQLIKQVQGQLKASFPSVAWAFGGVSEATQLETMRELAPAKFGKSPGLVAQTSMQANKIAEEEKGLLSKAGVTTVDSYRDPKTGAWFYSTVLIPRDSKGNVDLAALAKVGNLYQVIETTQGGKFTRQPVKVRPLK